MPESLPQKPPKSLKEYAEQNEIAKEHIRWAMCDRQRVAFRRSLSFTDFDSELSNAMKLLKRSDIRKLAVRADCSEDLALLLQCPVALFATKESTERFWIVISAIGEKIAG